MEERKAAVFDRATLSQGGFLNDIRKYMVAREGVDYESAEPDQVVDDFFEIQRSVEAGNSVSLVKEGLFFNQADQATRENIGNVYQLYKQSENIFQSDEPLEGVAEWAQSILLDPVNLVGLGIGRLATSAVGAKLGTQAIRHAAIKAAQAARAGGAAKAGQKAAYEGVMRREAKKAIASRAAATGAIEGSITAGSEYGTQAVRNNPKPEDEQNTDWAMVAAAGAIGAVAGGASFVFDGVKTARKPQELAAAMRTKPTAAAQAAAQQAAVQNLLKQMSQFDWQTSVNQGRTVLGAQKIMDPDLFKTLLLGGNGTNGVHDYLLQAGVKPNPDGYSKTIVDFFAGMPSQSKAGFDQMFDQATGGVYKSTDDFINSFAATANQSGSLFNTISQSSKQYATGLASKQAMANILNGNPQLNQVAAETYGLSYEKAFRNIWKRSLVSAIPTTAVNVLGSATYIVGQTVADTLSGAAFYASSPFIKGNLKKGEAYKRIIADRLRFVFNSDITSEVFQQAVKINPAALEAFQKTTNMGVSTTDDLLKQYNLEGASKFGQKAVLAGDKAANFAQWLTRVQAQDVFFKSLGFMDNMNQIMLKKHGMSFEEVISAGRYRELVTEDDLGKAVHGTLKMTFSADYTARNKMYNKTNQYTQALAQSVEWVSNSPLGYAMPFGRFMNNVVANTYQFSPFALVSELAPYLTKKGYSPDADVMSKAILGTAAITASYQAAADRREEGDPWHIVRYQGERYDLKNVYPASFILAAGELVYRYNNNEDYTDLMFLRDVGQQIAVGDIAEGLDVFEGTYAIVEALLDQNATEVGSVVGGGIGGILSGLTRPLTTPDVIVGALKGDLRSPDYNQESGFTDTFAAEAKRYTRRLFDAIAGSDGGEDFGMRKEAARPDVTTEENPVGLQFGIRQTPARTASEKMFEQAGMQAWQAGQRSEHSKYTRLANEEIFPILDQYARSIIVSKRWKNATEVERSGIVQGIMSKARTEVEARIEGTTKPEHLRYMIEKSILSAKASRTTNNAFDAAVRKLGLIGERPQDLNNKDLFNLYNLINQIKEENKF